MPSLEKALDDTAEYVADTSKGLKAGSTGFQLRVNTSNSCKVNILTAGKKSVPVVRFDAAHGGQNLKAHVPHVNINPKVNTNLKVDPHSAIPFGEAGLTGIEKTAKVCKTVNKILIPIAIAIDTYQLGKAAITDYKKGTTRNFFETAASIAGGWGGGYGGATGGAAIGTAIFPGIGTLIGGIVGGVIGGISGSLASRALTSHVSDQMEYDVEWSSKPCAKCGKKYKIRKYAGNCDNRCCDSCS